MKKRSILLVGGTVVSVILVLLLKQWEGDWPPYEFMTGLASPVATIEARGAASTSRRNEEGKQEISPERTNEPAPATVEVSEGEVIGTPEARLRTALQEGIPVLMLFHSTHCQPCKVMEAVIGRVRPDFESSIAFVDVIVSDPENESLIQHYQIRAIPTTVLIDRQGEAKVGLGVIQEADLRSHLEQMR